MHLLACNFWFLEGVRSRLRDEIRAIKRDHSFAFPSRKTERARSFLTLPFAYRYSSLDLLFELFPKPNTEETKAEEQHGGGFGDAGDLCRQADIIDRKVIAGSRGSSVNER